MKIELAYIDDWQGLYINGVLKLQGQNLELDEIFQAIEIDFKSNEVDSDWMDEQDFEYPKVLDKVKFI